MHKHTAHAFIARFGMRKPVLSWIKPARLARKFLALLLSSLLAFQPMLLQAQQITPDQTAGTNQPGIGTAPNGVPLIDIATPNGQGLSHNKYGDFNVGTEGVILNNHLGETGTSKLGGITPGNANLINSGPASVILNEVTSGNRSALQGPTEVFGNRADVIIANPNGITCNGCGFINAPRATLTTGTPDIDASGRLNGFTVRGGDVTFGARGGNFAAGDGAVDLFDVVSRSIRVDGPVNAKTLRLSAGRQQFDYASGDTKALDGASDASEFAIDGSALGAMQADRIKMIVTDKGAGVRMRADMAANAGELRLSADGKISLGNASGRDGVTLQSNKTVQATRLTSKQRVVVKAAKGISLQSVAADADIVLENGDGLLSVVADLASLSTIQLTSSGSIALGRLAAGGDASLQAQQGINASELVADGRLTANTTTGNIAIAGTGKSGSGDLVLTAQAGAINAGSLISFGNLTLQAGLDIAVSGDLLSAGNLIAKARSISGNNAIAGLDMAATAAAPNGAIVLGAAHDLSLTASGGAIALSAMQSSGNLNASGTSIAAQNITIQGAASLNGASSISGQLLAGGDVTIAGSSINAGAVVAGVDFAASKAAGNGAIIIGSNGNLQLNAGSAITLGNALAAGSFTAQAATLNAGNLTLYGATNIQASTAISGQLLSVGDVTIAGASINANLIAAGLDASALRQGNVVLGATEQSLQLAATSGDLTVAGLLSSGDITGQTSGNLSANVVAHGNLDLTAGGMLTLTGQSLAGNNVSLTANGLTIDTIVSGVDFAATNAAGGALIVKAGHGLLNLDAGNGSIQADQLLSGGDLTATAAQNIAYNALQSFANAALTTASGTISLDHKTIAAGNLTLSLQSLDLSNNRSQIATSGMLTVNANSASLANSTLTFGGLTLNLTGNADLSNSKLRAVMGDGGSGNIAISGHGLTLTTSSAILAANDLTLTLASLSNMAQLAAGRDLTFNLAGSFNNAPTGLVYAGRDGKLFVAGDLINDQGAILAGRDLTIAGDADGERAGLVRNISGMISADRDMAIKATDLENIRSVAPTMQTVQLSNDEIIKFVLNPATWGQPLGAVYANPKTSVQLDLYPDNPRPGTDEWLYQLYGIITLPDGSSYRTRPFIFGEDNSPWTFVGKAHSTAAMEAALKDFYQTDANGHIIVTPELQSKFIEIINKGDVYAEKYQWDDNTQLRQSVWEDQLSSNGSARALIKAGGNLTIDTVNLKNSYSAIEAGGNATIAGSGTLTNEGLSLYRTTTIVCEASGGCEAYDANGNRNGVNDLDKGGAGLTSRQQIGGVYSTIQSASAMSVTGFQQVNNASPDGSISGATQLASSALPSNPTDILGGMTAAGALYTPNAALIALSANGKPLMGADLLAALGATAPKPNSGGFGGTIPGQLFLYESRAEFLDVGKFYGSGYFINRIGYQPDRAIPFLGDAYFENQLIDQQLRDLIGQGLGKGSFIPGSDAIEQMKTLLDRGADYAKANGLSIGEKLSPQMVASLTQSIVWYEKQTVNGIEVLVPKLYLADADKAKLTVAGALISGGSLEMNVGNIANSGAIAAKTDLKLDASNITATGGQFKAGNDLTLSASQNLTLSAGTTQIGKDTFVLPGSGVTAGGNASLGAGEALTLKGADVKAGGDVVLEGKSVTLDMAKATNQGSDNIVGSSLQAGGNASIHAQNDVNIIGSNVAAGKQVALTAEQGSVNVVAGGVDKKVNSQAGDGTVQIDRTFVQQSQLSSGSDTTIKAGDDILIAGSKVKAGGNVALQAGDDVNITVAQQSEQVSGKNLQQNSQLHVGTEISAGGSVSVQAGTSADPNKPHDLNIIGSKIDAGGKVNLSATDNVTIAAAHDTEYAARQSSSKRLFGSKSSSSVMESDTLLGSSISGGAGVNIASGNDTIIAASKVTAGNDNQKADISIDAGGNLIVTSGKDTLETDSSNSKSGFLSKSSGKSHSYDERTVASELSASGNVKLNAGDNVVIAGSKVNADGSIAMSGDSVSIIGAQEAHDAQSSSKKSGFGVGSGDGFYSIWGKKEQSSSEALVLNSQSSISAGKDVIITARAADINIIGSSVEAGRDINLEAARDVNILPGAESQSSEEKEKRSGFGVQLKSSEGSASIGIGFAKSKDETRQNADTNAGSSLKAGNNVNITAGRDANLQAARVEADKDVSIVAERDVNLLAAQDITNYEHVHEELFAGVTAQVSTGLVGAAKSIGNAADKVSKVSDGYSAANAAFAGLKAYDAIKNLQSIANGTGNVVSASLTAGFQYSKSQQEAQSSTPVVTGIRGGNSVVIEATSGDINSHGAQIIAGYDANGLPVISDSKTLGDISLEAGNDINLLSAQATNNSSSSNKSAGASIGVSAGVNIAGGVGLGLTGNVNAGSGKSSSNGTTQVNSHVTGTGNITLESGRDTNLKGATVKGDTITANVGRDLNIISVPDTGESKNKSASFGIGFSGGLDLGSPLEGSMPSLGSQIGNMSASSLSPGFGTGSGTTSWISEQSGLISNGRMDVTVGGNTHLGAGKIVSESGDLTLDTGTLTFENFSGSKQYEGFDIQANIDLTAKDQNGDKQQRPDQTSQPKTTAEGSYQLDDTRQEVRATVGPGTIIIRDKDKQAQIEAEGKTEDVASLNRDPDKAYEITKDKHVEIEYYFSDTSMKAALEAGKSTVEIIINAFGQMANDGKLSPQDYQTAIILAKYKDDPSVLAQLEACGQKHGFNRYNPLNWLVTSAYAQAPCVIAVPEGSFPISPEGAATCKISFGMLASKSGIIGVLAGVILVATTTSTGEIKSQTQTMDDGSVVRITGDSATPYKMATIESPDGSITELQLYLNPVTGDLELVSGTLDGKPLARSDLQSIKYGLQSAGVENVVLSESSKGGGNGGSASKGGSNAASGTPDPDNDGKFKRPNDNLQKGDKVDLNRFEQRVKVDGEVRFRDPKSGYEIVKDRAGGNSHGGSAWKLLDRTGSRVGTLNADGTYLRN